MKVWIYGHTGRMGKELIEALTQKEWSSVESPKIKWQLYGGNNSKEIFYYKNSKEGGSSSPLTSETLHKALLEADAILDFSQSEGHKNLLRVLSHADFKNKKLSLLVGTTALNDQDKSSWDHLLKQQGFSLRLLFAPNTSLGILLLSRLMEQAFQILDRQNFDTEIIEAHHRQKKDAPSGTAFYLFELLKALEASKNLNTQYKDKRTSSEIGMHSVRGGGVLGEHEIRFLGDHEEVYLGHRAINRKLFAEGALFLLKWLSQKNSGVYQLKDVSLKDLIGT